MVDIGIVFYVTEILHCILHCHLLSLVSLRF